MEKRNLTTQLWSCATPTSTTLCQCDWCKAPSPAIIKKLTALLTAILFAWSMICPMGFAETINLEGGSVDVNTQDNVTNWNVQGNPVWNVPEFNVAQGSIYNIAGLNQGASLALLVNGGQATNIFGTMNLSNIAFILQNLAGINIGNTGLINLSNASLMASTLPLNLNATDFLKKDYQFSGQGGLLSNEGRIIGTNSDLVALISNAIENKGVIEMPMGTVALAAGKTVTVGISGDGLVSIGVDEATANAMGLKDQIKNTGTISANGGTVSLTAKAVDGLFDKAINIAREDNAVGAVIADDGVIEFVAQGDISSIGNLQAKRGEIKIEATGDVETLGVLKTSHLDEKAASFQIGGLYSIQSSSHDNLDQAITFSADVTVTGAEDGSGADGIIYDAENIIINAGVTLTLGSNFTFSADYDVQAAPGSESNGSGAFLMQRDGDSIAAIDGAGFDLTIRASDDSDIGIISNVRTLTLARNSASEDISYTSLTDADNIDDIDVVTFKTESSTATGVTFIKTVGDGSEETPFLIYDITQLQAMNNDLAASYDLANNIDASSTLAWNGGAGFVPVGHYEYGYPSIDNPYIGTFDGQNHTITGLTIDRSGTDYVGLFGYTNNAAIHDLTIEAANITGATYVGGLVGFSGGTSSIDNVYVNGAISLAGQWDAGGIAGVNHGSITNSGSSGSVVSSGQYNTGGLVGQNFGTIDHSYSSSSVSGQDSQGGLVGNNEGGLITNSFATGDVYGSSWSTGGFVGLNGWDLAGTIRNCYATGNVSADANTVGGFVGNTGNNGSGIISDSYATGDVTVSGDYVGGFAGFTGGGTISNSYSTGTVSASGSVVGGFVGWQGAGTISNSFSTSAVTGAASVGGFTGQYDSGILTNNFWLKNAEHNSVLNDISSEGDVTDTQIATEDTLSNFFNTTHPVYNGVGPWDFGALWQTLQSSHPLFQWEVNIWSDAGSGLWSDAANWSKGVVSTAASTVLFNATSTAVSTLDALFAGSVNKLYIDTGYTGTLNQDSALTVAGVYSQAAGTSNNNNTLTLKDLSLSGGTFNQGSDISITDNYVQTGGTFTDTLPLNHDFTVAGSFSVPYAADGNFNRYTGAGDSANPFIIRDIYDLQAMKNHLDAHLKLDASIDAMGVEDWNGGLGFDPIGDATHQFIGTLSGLGNVISNLSIHRDNENYVGLFGYIGSGGAVTELGLKAVSAYGQNHVGGLAGLNEGSLLKIAVDGAFTVSGVNMIGGIVGENLGSIKYASSRAFVNGADFVGGLVGKNSGTGTIDQTIAAYGKVTGTGNNVGGLVGQGDSSWVTRSFYDPYNSGQAESPGGGIAAKVPRMIEDGVDESGNKIMIYDPEYLEDPAPNLMSSPTYSAWDDFGGNWVIDEGSSLPALKVIHPDGIKAAWGNAYDLHNNNAPLIGVNVALYVNHDPDDEIGLGEQRDLTKTSAQGNYYFEMEPGDVVSTDWVIGKIEDNVYFGNARMKAGEGSIPGLNVPGDRADVLTNPYQKITLDTPPIRVPDNQDPQKAEEAADRSLQSVMNNTDQLAASAEGVWGKAADVQIQDETFSVPGIETELPHNAGISFYDEEPVPGREPVATFTLSQVGTQTQELRSGSTKSVMMEIAEKLMQSPKGRETSGNGKAISTPAAGEQAADGTGSAGAAVPARDEQADSKAAPAANGQANESADAAGQQTSASDEQAAESQASSEKDAASSADRGAKSEANFFNEEAKKFLTDIRVVEGAVYVVDSANEVSFLTPGESVRVFFKEQAAALLKARGAASVAGVLDPKPMPVKADPPPMAVTADPPMIAVKSDPPPLMAVKSDLSTTNVKTDLSTVSVKTNPPETVEKTDLSVKTDTLPTAMPPEPKDISKFAPSAVVEPENGNTRYGTLKNPGKNVFVRFRGGEWQAATDGMVILPGDEVRTAAKSSVEVLLDGGNVGHLEIQEGSLFRINRSEIDLTTWDKTTLLDLAIGKMLIQVEKLKGSSKFEVRTPTALTGVRGTIFEVTVKEKNKTRK